MKIIDEKETQKKKKKRAGGMEAIATGGEINDLGECLSLVFTN